ncbi:hypothetical protein FQN57_007366 [Myotisia sp. PD_48]|nr:hypothetical protein FQN57_007366 [Myotisia sp. PD_48]
MLARLISSFTPARPPSAVLVIGRPGQSIDILHLVPEDGTLEHFGESSKSPTLHCFQVIEQAREQIGTVILHVGDGEDKVKFMNDVRTHVRKFWNDFLGSNPARVQIADDLRMAQLVQDVLKPAAL